MNRLLKIVHMLYSIRVVMVTVTMSIVGVTQVLFNDEDVSICIIICSGIAILYLCALLSRFNSYYICSKKKFVFLDQNGNPCIHKEDIHEIVDYLYRMEKEHENR